MFFYTHFVYSVTSLEYAIPNVLQAIFTSNIPSACQIIDNLTCTRGYFGRLFPEKNLEYVPLQAVSNRYFNDS
jgi:hypothetical protein